MNVIKDSAGKDVQIFWNKGKHSIFLIDWVGVQGKDLATLLVHIRSVMAVWRTLSEHTDCDIEKGTGKRESFVSTNIHGQRCTMKPLVRKLLDFIDCQ